MSIEIMLAAVALTVARHCWHSTPLAKTGEQKQEKFGPVQVVNACVISLQGLLQSVGPGAVVVGSVAVVEMFKATHWAVFARIESATKESKGRIHVSQAWTVSLPAADSAEQMQLCVTHAEAESRKEQGPLRQVASSWRFSNSCERANKALSSRSSG